MKVITMIKVSVLTVSLFLTATPTTNASSNNELEFNNLIACLWVTYCGQDIYSPVPTPKDVKTETQDAKDEKLA
jgi:hypothetical protein